MAVGHVAFPWESPSTAYVRAYIVGVVRVYTYSVDCSCVLDRESRIAIDTCS